MAGAFETRILNGIGMLAAVAESGSFVAASEMLGLTPSAVSRGIARLEQRLGLRLFHRTSRTVALTDEGRRFLQKVKPLLEGLEETVATASGSASAVEGRLRVNVDAIFARLVLLPRIGELLAAHPRLSLDVVVRDRLGDLVSDGFDAAVRFAEPQQGSAVARRLTDLRVLTCAAPAYLARHGTPVRPRDLAREGHECILFIDPTTGRPFPWEFHRGGRVAKIEVSGRLILNDAAALQAACIAGHGVAQMLEVGLSELFDSRRLVQLFPEWAEERFPLYAFHPTRHFVPTRVRAFLDFVSALVPQLGSAHPATGRK